MRIIGLDIHHAFVEAMAWEDGRLLLGRVACEEGSERQLKQVCIIAHARIKTDTIDAGALAQLYASGFLLAVQMGYSASGVL